MGAKTDPALVAVMRQEFMAGARLRQLAGKHGLTLRTLARLSKDEGWEYQRDCQWMSTTLPALEKVADARVEAVNWTWEERLQGAVDFLAIVAERASAMLAGVDIRAADLRDLCGTIKIAVDTLNKIQSIMPAQMANKTQDLNTFIMPPNPDEQKNRVSIYIPDNGRGGGIAPGISPSPDGKGQGVGGGD